MIFALPVKSGTRLSTAFIAVLLMGFLMCSIKKVLTFCFLCITLTHKAYFTAKRVERLATMRKSMRKDTTICFRASKEVRTALEKVTQKTKRSMSSVIEDIISCYLQENKALQYIEKEKRRFIRKEVSIPIVVKDPDTKNRLLQAGTIMDISLGGLRISLPKDFAGEIAISSHDYEFEAIFTLPSEQRPISIKCKPHRSIAKGEERQMGVSFVDSDFSSYKTLQSYLM
jgi:predicted DNA-binding protein